MLRLFSVLELYSCRLIIFCEGDIVSAPQKVVFRPRAYV